MCSLILNLDETLEQAIDDATLNHGPAARTSRDAHSPRVLRPHGAWAWARRHWPRCWMRQIAGGRRLATPARAAGPAGAAAFCAQGQARHLPVPERRAVARRPVRLQAEARPSGAGKQIPDSVQAGKRLSTHDQRPDGAGPCCRRSPSLPSTGQAGRGSATSCRTPRRSPTICASSSSMHTEQVNHAPAITLLPDRRRAAGPADDRRLADLRPGQRQRRTCRRSSS